MVVSYFGPSVCYIPILFDHFLFVAGAITLLPSSLFWVTVVFLPMPRAVRYFSPRPAVLVASHHYLFPGCLRHDNARSGVGTTAVLIKQSPTHSPRPCHVVDALDDLRPVGALLFDDVIVGLAAVWPHDRS